MRASKPTTMNEPTRTTYSVLNTVVAQLSAKLELPWLGEAAAGVRVGWMEAVGLH